jgi:hypothetical protein
LQHGARTVVASVDTLCKSMTEFPINFGRIRPHAARSSHTLQQQQCYSALSVEVRSPMKETLK